MAKTRPEIRLVVLGALFFVVFLNLVTYINSAASLRNRYNSLIARKEQAIVEKNGFESDALKQTRDVVSFRQGQENLVRIGPNEIKRPIDIQREPRTTNPVVSQPIHNEIGLIGR